MMSRFSLGVPLALSILLADFRMPAATAADKPEKPYADTAIGALLDANEGRIPATGVELVAALAKLGDFLQLAIPFSAVDAHSGLTHPRIVIAMRPSTHPTPVSEFDGGGGWGGSSPRPKVPVIALTPAPLGMTGAGSRHLEGRLFLAANTGLQGPGRPIVKTVEFLSWNTTALKFDFGVIEGLGGGTPVVKMLDGKRCFSCHKNRGPILGDAPWSNSMHNAAVRTAAKSLLKFPHEPDQSGREDLARPLLGSIDGMTLLTPHAVEVDAAIRQGADRLRDRAAIGRLTKTETGRQVFATMLAAIPTHKPIGEDKAVRFEMDRLDLVKFLQEDFAAQKSAAPNRLLNFSPVGMAPVNSVLRYDAARARDEPGLPSAHQPSNPKAFVRPVAKAQRVSEVVSVMTLARAIGLTEADREFLSNSLDITARRFGSPALATGAIAKLIFAGANFADVFESGVLPDRDGYKDRFFAGLDEVVQTGGESSGFRGDRKNYASAPARDPNYRAPPEKTLLPSHACLACHDVRGAKPAAFNPIPPLAFDPFDYAARAAWSKIADRAEKVRVLERLIQRLSTDRDMPPEDSREADTFRGKDFDAVKDWLIVELKKAKGG